MARPPRKSRIRIVLKIDYGDHGADDFSSIHFDSVTGPQRSGVSSTRCDVSQSASGSGHLFRFIKAACSAPVSLLTCPSSFIFFFPIVPNDNGFCSFSLTSSFSFHSFFSLCLILNNFYLFLPQTPLDWLHLHHSYILSPSSLPSEPKHVPRDPKAHLCKASFTLLDRQTIDWHIKFLYMYEHPTPAPET